MLYRIDRPFKLDSVAYGSGFVLNLDLFTATHCRLEAQLERISIETGVATAPSNR